jgi:hypothetical protein
MKLVFQVLSPPSGASIVVGNQTYNTISKHTIMTTLKGRQVFALDQD